MQQGTVKSAQQLVLTFFLDDGPFPQSPSLPIPTNLTRYEDSARDVAARAWRQAVHDVVDHRGWASPVSVDPMGLTTSARGPTRHVLLKFLPHLTVAAHPRRLENVIYGVGYLLVTLYVWRYIGKLRAHSKMGLLVTGVVELTASGIMSVSICWLMGWDLGLVPWCVRLSLPRSLRPLGARSDARSPSPAGTSSPSSSSRRASTT